MYDKMRLGMAQATRLTRAGRLEEATATIQRTLQGLKTPEADSLSAEPPRKEPLKLITQVINADLEPAILSVPTTSRQTQANEGATTVEKTPKSQKPQSLASLFNRSQPWRDTVRSPGSKLSGLGSLPRLKRTGSEVPTGGQFIDGSYTNQAGTRSYKLYIPSAYQGQALPLVVMLHGCTQTPDDFAAGTRMNVLAEKELFFVVYPAQAIAANPSQCWNWFKVDDQQRDRGEPSLIAGITYQIVSDYQVDSRRIYLAGMSAGGAMAAIMGVSYPDVYAAIGLHSGLAYGVASNLPSALAAMQHGGNDEVNAGSDLKSRSTVDSFTQKGRDDSRVGTSSRFVPIIVFQGERDATVHPRNADQVLSQWATIYSRGISNLGVSVTQKQVTNGHGYTRSLYQDKNGYIVMEKWLVHGAGHAWSGGSLHGSFTDPKGPDASSEMVRFFWEHPQNE